MPKKQTNNNKNTPKKKTQPKKTVNKNSNIKPKEEKVVEEKKTIVETPVVEEKEIIVEEPVIVEEVVVETKEEIPQKSQVVDSSIIEDEENKINLFDGKTSLKELTLTVKIISVIFNILNIGLLVLIICFGIYSSYKALSVGLDEIIKDNSIVTFVELANTSSILSAENIILSYKNTALFVFIEILIPVIVISITLVALFVFWKYAYRIAKSAKSNNQLFTWYNLELVKRMKDIITLSIIIILLLCGFELIIIWFLLVVIMEIIYYLFKYSVDKTN